jgi:pullulanase
MKRFIAQLALLLAVLAAEVYAAEPSSVSLAGTFQTALGCSGNWSTNCANSALIKEGSEWSATYLIPPGSWEYKVALNGSWDESYGYNQGSSNATFTLASEKWVTFTYNQDTHLLTDTALVDGPVVTDPQPQSVAIVGDLQQVLGCAGDWNPACTATQLILGSDKVWRQTFTVPAGNWLFKAALNGSWYENYGANARAGGDNIPLVLASPRAVTFYYSHKTHWVTNNVNSVIASAVGNFQTALGCPGNWQPECLRGWLQDTSGTGLYTFSTTAIPVGNYEAKIAINETWDESYGKAMAIMAITFLSALRKKTSASILLTMQKIIRLI